MWLCKRDLSKECEGKYRDCTDCVLDKIRAEIEPTRKMYLEMNDIDWLNGCDYVLSVIDKYKAEGENV